MGTSDPDSSIANDTPCRENTKDVLLSPVRDVFRTPWMHMSSVNTKRLYAVTISNDSEYLHIRRICLRARPAKKTNPIYYGHQLLIIIYARPKYPLLFLKMRN